MGNSDRPAQHTRGAREEAQQEPGASAPAASSRQVLFSPLPAGDGTEVHKGPRSHNNKGQSQDANSDSPTLDPGLLPPVTSCQITEEPGLLKAPLGSVEMRCPPGDVGSEVSAWHLVRL